MGTSRHLHAEHLQPQRESGSLKVAEEAVKLRAAQLRSMPVTRMLDYNMDHWDAMQLAATPPERAWDEAAATLAQQQLGVARAAAQRGDVETAVACYRRATAAFVFAQMAFNRDSDRKRELYLRMSDAYGQAARLDTALAVERLDVPFRSASCNGWLVQPHSAVGAVVVIVGGQSGWGPAYHRQARELARRGLSTVLLEAPGQGETRMLRGLVLDHHVHEAFGAVVDLLIARGHGGPFGVWGNSFGGLLAARAAMRDPRFAACCVNGAPSRPAPAPFRTAAEQSQAMLGVGSEDATSAALRTLWIDPETDRMRASLLVLHGGLDPLVSLQQQEPFLGLSDAATLRVWDDGEHTIYNHAAERTEFVADWFRALLTSPSI